MGRAFPRTAHFIWLDEQIPPERQACIDSCIDKHPGWDIHVWRDIAEFGLLRNRRAFFGASQIAPAEPRGNPWQIRTNVLRFEIMLRFGGVFLDSDVVCLKPLDPLLEKAEAEECSGILGWEIQDRWLGEAVIACLPGAAFMDKLVSNLEPWAFARKAQAATKTVGPQYVTPQLLGSPEIEEVMVVSQQTFFPARHDQPKLSSALASGAVKAHPDTYAVHLFGNFRRKQALGLAK